ncbi:MAG: hypothetical protein QOE90_179 [Thermoplasmata archaeon]|jgi:hypothetical protein|nr:hypothetical protein [Thermoplasmata archaeon]
MRTAFVLAAVLLVPTLALLPLVSASAVGSGGIDPLCALGNGALYCEHEYEMYVQCTYRQYEPGTVKALRDSVVTIALCQYNPL